MLKSKVLYLILNSNKKVLFPFPCSIDILVNGYRPFEALVWHHTTLPQDSSLRLVKCLKW
jgi:hypothetical protein